MFVFGRFYQSIMLCMTSIFCPHRLKTQETCGLVVLERIKEDKFMIACATHHNLVWLNFRAETPQASLRDM